MVIITANGAAANGGCFVFLRVFAAIPGAAVNRVTASRVNTPRVPAGGGG
jgi:hypothetical protein